MKKIFVTLMMVFAIFISNWGDLDIVKAQEKGEEMRLIDCIPLDEFSTWYVYEKQESSTKAVQSRGKTIYLHLKVADCTVLSVSHTVGFSYGYSDGKARITSNTYSVQYVEAPYSVGNFSTSSSNGNPATASLSFTTYKNGTKISTRTNKFKCYNNGNVYY
ncbi:MAG: hypothetical protein HFJ06_14085 [Lachnospiraceae bacterium]|nr:hypothetical protein [Lachnospiraceae bacterium]